MSRSKWKGNFLTNINFIKTEIEKSKMWMRNSSISSGLIGKRLLIHNGKSFKTVFITREKVGFKFGEFSFTRTHTLKIKKTILKNGAKSKPFNNKK